MKNYAKHNKIRKVIYDITEKKHSNYFQKSIKSNIFVKNYL